MVFLHMNKWLKHKLNMYMEFKVIKKQLMKLLLKLILNQIKINKVFIAKQNKLSKKLSNN